LKQAAAILLSVVLLFNWYGFQPLMNWMDARADNEMVQQLNQLQYEESSLIEISVTTNLPYTNNWTDFERTDGTVEFNGKHYSYVMRKMVDGKMIYKCIPNEERNNISSVRNEFFKQAFDASTIATSKKQDSNKSISVKKTMEDFTDNLFQITFPVAVSQNPSYIIANTHLANGFNVLPYQPPQA
jgi:hypothetical protein